MKKILAVILLALMVTVLTVGLASAQGGIININGQVFSFDESAGTLTLKTKRGDTLVVAVLEDFDFTGQTGLKVEICLTTTTGKDK